MFRNHRSLYLPTPGRLRAPRNSILIAEIMAMELKVLCRHAPDGSLSGKKPGELQPNVACPYAIAILWQPAILILANAQATNSIVVLSTASSHGPARGLLLACAQVSSNLEPNMDAEPRCDSGASAGRNTLCFSETLFGNNTAISHD